MSNKASAYRFLKTLQDRLNESAVTPEEIRSRVDAVWSKPTSNKTEKEKLESKENIPFYDYVLPEIFALGQSTASLSESEMRRALRCVYFAKFPEFSAANVFRKSGYPFSKKFGATTDSIMKAWQKPATRIPANQAWPEAGLAQPFPFKILFEAKYFESGNEVSAETQFVAAVYETAFYRGLPADDDWSYDYGCLVAYDVSQNGHFSAAWESVSSKRLFWEDANLFIMIVRGGKGREGHSGKN